MESNADCCLKAAVDNCIAAIQQRAARSDEPIVVAIDGGSGSGKSTIALLIAERLGAALIPGDDFFAADIPDAAWDSRTPEAKAADVINWRRLRSEALDPLLAGRPAKWHAFDFAAGVRPDGTYRMRSDFVERRPAKVIVIDGAYSTGSELAEMIDISVLVDVPVAERHKRLAARGNTDSLRAWHARWDDAEQYYFTHIRPASSFDLVLTNASSTQRQKGPLPGREIR